MPILKRDDFFELVRGKISRDTFKKAIHQKTLVEDEEGHLDTDNAKNAKWLLKHKNDLSEREQAELTAKREQNNLLAKEETELKLRKMRIATELEEMKLLKMHGELVPTEVVRQMMGVHFQSVTKTMEQALRQLIKDMRIVWEGDEAEVPNLMQKMEKLLNNAVDKAHRMTENELEKIVQEFSEKRGRGEKKSA